MTTREKRTENLIVEDIVISEPGVGEETEESAEVSESRGAQTEPLAELLSKIEQVGEAEQKDIAQETVQLLVDDTQPKPILKPDVPQKSKSQYLLSDSQSAILEALNWQKGCLEWIWSFRTPLIVLATIALVPKMVLVWIVLILAKPAASWLYRHAPTDFQERLATMIPDKIKQSPYIRDIDEGTDQGLPFILFWLYLFLAPFALVWMMCHWIKSWLPEKPVQSNGESTIAFKQNERRDALDPENNFYHSRAFGIVLLLFFLSGLPAVFTYGVYERSGMAQVVGSLPDLTVHTLSPSPGLNPFSPTPASPNGTSSPTELTGWETDSGTVVYSYTANWPTVEKFGIKLTRSSVFWVHFYLASVACALCILFFRAWFSFPLNFLADEHTVELTEYGVKRRGLKNWFLNVLTINRFAVGGGPDSLTWQEVKSLRRSEEGFTKLYPLPESAFKKESFTYKFLNKIAAFLDGICSRLNVGNYLIFSSATTGSDFARNIRINLNDLTREQRAKLFYAVKTWAPHVVINKAAEEELLGSTVLRDNRYTQLWFDMLTSRAKSRRKDILASGEQLHQGLYTVDERLSSGGQATTYLATKQSGEKCVLKEFVLCTSTESGAMVESAREFEAEVSLLSEIHHPGIVSLQDYFFEAGRVYVVLEYIPGRSLRQIIQEQGPMSEEKVASVAASLCDVLEYLHNCTPPIVHRDVTPENILVQEDGTVKLIDFSLAVKQDGRQTTDSCAKQCFTPPEQFREEVCTQSDIYALGATMYFLLTGRTPKPISRSSPKAKNPKISESMNKIVEHATELEVEKRYESVHWLKLDVMETRPESNKEVGALTEQTEL